MPPSLDALRQRAKTWIDPISPEAPAGKAAKLDPDFEFVMNEVAKLDAVSGGTVNWEQVLEKGESLLQKTTKDLKLAAHLAYGLYVTQGLDGLSTGLVGVAEMMSSFWPTLFPEATRMRGRVGALVWLISKLGQVLPSRKVGGADREALEALAVATKRLSEVSREKFANDCPALGPLVDAVERLRATVPAEAAPPPPPPQQAAPPPPSQPQAAPPPSQAAPQAAAPALQAPSAAPLADAAGTVDFLRQIGTSLAEAASLVRRANMADPTSYRILRTGLWLHMSQAPGSGGKSQIPPLPAQVRTQLERMSTNGKWSEVLDESESNFGQFRFALDLQYYTATALAGLGDSHRAAKEAVVIEVASLLKRMPPLLDLHAGDGSPLVGPETRSWIESEVLTQPAGASGGAAKGPAKAAAAADGAPAEDARALLSAGKPAEAIGLLQVKVLSASGGRARFLARLELAKLCVAAGNKALARTLYEGLDKECVERNLDEWDPALSAACLEGLLVLSKKDSTPAEQASRVRRLAQVDPVAALRMGL